MNNLKITKNVLEANMITHDGKFHPDDVFSTMFLAKILDEPVVYRASVRDVPQKEGAIIYDIGFGKFDHHGSNARFRENSSIKYCSFGLLWEEYGLSYLVNIGVSDSRLMYKRIIEKLVKQIDGIDNGLFYKIDSLYEILDLDKIIDNFNNTWDEVTDNNDNFMRAVAFAEIIFDNLIKREEASVKALKLVQQQIDKVKDNILVLEQFMPYSEAIFTSDNPKAKDIKVVILPSNRGGYNIKPMTISLESKEVLINFPQEYRGLHDEELAHLSGIKTANFVHASGFLASAATLEDAILLAKVAIAHGK